MKVHYFEADLGVFGSRLGEVAFHVISFKCAARG